MKKERKIVSQGSSNDGSKTFVYRGILVEINGPYSMGTTRRVVVHTPDIERYFRSTAGIRRFIDKFLHSYKPVDNGIPF